MGTYICKKCGKGTLSKNGEIYLCDKCGSKFLSSEIEADLMADNALNATSQLDTIYQLAENAMSKNDYNTAVQHYITASKANPSEWKALFYIEYCKTMQSNVTSVVQNAVNLANVSTSVLKAMNDSQLGGDDLKIALFTISKRLNNASHHLGLVLLDGERPEMNRIQEAYEKWLNIFNIGYTWGNNIIGTYGDSMGPIAAECWIIAVTEHNRFLNSFQQFLPQARAQSGRDTVNQFSNAIRKYRSSFTLPPPKQPQQQQTSGGCYIATCVYGSYDCPEVWVLRRYRDNTLATTWQGRLFISLYYTMSPILVCVFGDKKWFKKFWIKKLDVMVMKLRNSGFEDTPYTDKTWD